jgi:hypothetical protein
LRALSETTLDARDFQGVLAAQGKPSIIITETEYNELSRYLFLHRSENWLADFIAVECAVFEKGQHLTPHDVIHFLVGNMDQWDGDIDTTKRMLRDFPAMFQTEVAACVANAPISVQISRKRSAR